VALFLHHSRSPRAALAAGVLFYLYDVHLWRVPQKDHQPASVCPASLRPARTPARRLVQHLFSAESSARVFFSLRDVANGCFFLF
jgi:hypothetical protein